MDTTALDAKKLEIGAVEQLLQGDLERAIREAQEWDTTMDREAMTRVNDLWLKEGQVYIPADTEIKLRILKAHHDGKTAGRLRQDKTLELIAREYTLPEMREFINEYVRTCDTCARNKTPRRRHHGQLHLLPIPKGP